MQGDKPIELEAGDMLKIVTDYSFVGNKSCIACSYEKLPTSVKPGAKCSKAGSAPPSLGSYLILHSRGAH